MKKIYLIFILLIGISISCTDDFEELNTDTKKPTEVPGNFLFANAQKALADQVSSTNVNNNILKLVAQYWTETTYTDETNYDIVGRTISDFMFRNWYRDCLADFSDAKKAIGNEVVAGDEAITIQKNRLLITDLMMVYVYNRLVDIFGNVPYSQALDIDNISPAYDDAFTIYKDLIARTDAAIAGLNNTYGSFGSDDLLFGGDIDMWVKFARSLNVKMGITIADHDAALSKSTVEANYAGAFGPDEICEFQYLGGANSNQLYIDLVQSGRHDFVPANTLVDYMNGIEDPRRPAFFEINGDEYVGGNYGEGSNFDGTSHIADPIQEADFPMTLLDGTEISFYLAEAAARGYSVGGDAATHYNNAITASFTHWGLASEAAAYIAKPEVAYDAANWKMSIGNQAWLAYYLRGYIAYNSWRRLDYPILTLPPSPEQGVIPTRFTYPVNEQTLNASNYAAASAAIGGDFQYTKVFWDKQ